MDNIVELTPDDLERQLTPEEQAEYEKTRHLFRFGIDQVGDSGAVHIFPMNGAPYILIHSKEEAEWLTHHLMDCFRKE